MSLQPAALPPRTPALPPARRPQLATLPPLAAQPVLWTARRMPQQRSLDLQPRASR